MRQPMAWQEGFLLWQTHQVDMSVRALRQALMAGGVTAAEVPKPRVFPTI